MCLLLFVAEACKKPPVVTIEEAPHPVVVIAERDFLGAKQAAWHHGNL